MPWFVALLVGCAPAVEVPDPPPPAPAAEVAPDPEAPVVEAPAPPRFEVAVEPLPAELRVEMEGVSWHEACPVPFDDLRLMRVRIRQPGDTVGTGRLVVHARAVDVVRAAFEAAFDAGFPIARMEPVSAFGGDDGASMAANNTSGFNCRPIAGGGRWSQHAYGTAVDVNPLWNPFVRGERVDPPEGRAWLTRDGSVPGVLVEGSALTQAFRTAGWGWGGTWRSSKDYQHFSESGT